MALLVMVGGICLHGRGDNSEVTTASVSNGNLTSAEKSIPPVVDTGKQVLSLPGSPVLVSQASLQRLPTKPHRVTLSWLPSTPSSTTGQDSVSGYNVYRRNASSIRYIRLNSDPVPDTLYVDNSVRSGETYSYQTTAVNYGGIESAPSNQVKVTIPYP